jgi:hypothetical protein
MKLNQSQYALEISSEISDGKVPIGNLLLKYRDFGLENGILVPDVLIAELEDFAARNSVNALHKKKAERHCCIRCLKAHARRKSEELGLNRKVREFLVELFECEEGHNGYYLDRENLIQVED